MLSQSIFVGGFIFDLNQDKLYVMDLLFCEYGLMLLRLYQISTKFYLKFLVSVIQIIKYLNV